MKNMKQNWLALQLLALDLFLALFIVVNGYRNTSSEEPVPTPTVLITATSTPFERRDVLPDAPVRTLGFLQKGKEELGKGS